MPFARFSVARQPILDRSARTIGYELLCRPLEAMSSPEMATASVILHSFGDLGLSSFVGTSTAYVNVTREFLLAHRPLPLPADRVVLELLEDQRVDAALLDVLGELASDGFRLALDDFLFTPELAPLVELADIVKLDVRQHDAEGLARAVERLSGRGVRLIAEKVEDAEEHQFCHELGFDAFQGYFYARPETWSGRIMPTTQLATLCALAAAGSDATLGEIETIVLRDAGLSHRLLRFANSAHVSPRDPVRSLPQALALLGTGPIRRWAMLIAVAGMRDVPHALLETSLVRARAAEELAAAVPGADSDRAFIVGLFSLLDAITARSLPSLLDGLHLHPAIVAALLDGNGPEGQLLAALRTHERGESPAGGAPSELAVAQAYGVAIRELDARLLAA